LDRGLTKYDEFQERSSGLSIYYVNKKMDFVEWLRNAAKANGENTPNEQISAR
jgi:hypothetical protein